MALAQNAILKFTGDKLRDQDAALRAAIAASEPSKAANDKADARLQETLARTAEAEARLASMGEKAAKMEALLVSSEQRISYLEKLPVTPGQMAQSSANRSDKAADEAKRDRNLTATEASDVASLMERIGELGLDPDA